MCCLKSQCTETWQLVGRQISKTFKIKHWPPETTAVSVWTSALTSCEWFLKVLVRTHSLSCWSTVEGKNWNWTTVPSDVPAITLLSSCEIIFKALPTVQLWALQRVQSQTCVETLGEISTCETDRARTSHFVTKCVLINVPVNPSQIWTFPAESPLIIVWSDKKVTSQTTTSLLLDAPMALSTKSLCVVWPKVGIREGKKAQSGIRVIYSSHLLRSGSKLYSVWANPWIITSLLTCFYVENLDHVHHTSSNLCSRGMPRQRYNTTCQIKSIKCQAIMYTVCSCTAPSSCY